MSDLDLSAVRALLDRPLDDGESKLERAELLAQHVPALLELVSAQDEALRVLRPAAATEDWHAEYGRVLVQAFRDRDGAKSELLLRYAELGAAKAEARKRGQQLAWLGGQVQTLRGLCDGIARMDGYDPQTANVTVREIRRIIDMKPSVGSGEPSTVEQADVHPESYCHRCKGPNVSWSAPSPLWNEVMRGGDINGPWQFDEIICPTCFAVLAEESGIANYWQFNAPCTTRPLMTVTPSGRVWDEQTWMWVDPNCPCEEDPWDGKHVPTCVAGQIKAELDDINAQVAADRRVIDAAGRMRDLLKHQVNPDVYSPEDDELIAAVDARRALDNGEGEVPQ